MARQRTSTTQGERNSGRLSYGEGSPSRQSGADSPSGGVTDHGALTGLGDDDHAQYHNDTRGDARYSLLAHTHAFADLTAKPTTMAGYGITDFNSLGDARWSLLGHTHTVSAISDMSANARTFNQAADYSAMRTALGVRIGSDVQPYDTDLSTWAGLTPSANAQSFVTAADYAAMRVLLGLVIGTNVQAYNAVLTTIAGASADGQSLVTAADYAAMRTLLGLVIGTNVQAYDADLAAIAGLASAADKGIQFTGSGTAQLIDLKQGVEAAYSGTPTWTAGAAPSGTANLRQFFTQVGNLVTWQIMLTYANAGTTVTNLSLTFPTEFPTPAIPTGFTGADVYLYGLGPARLVSTPTGTVTVVNTFFIARNSANNGFVIKPSSAFTSGTYRTFHLMGSYFTS